MTQNSAVAMRPRSSVMRRQTVAIIEILARQTKPVIQNRIGKIRQLFHRFDERVRTPNVVQVRAQQLAPAKTREKILRIQTKSS